MEKNCKTCKHQFVSGRATPCNDCCEVFPTTSKTMHWEPADISPDLCAQGEKREMFEKVEVEDFRKLVSALWLYATNNAWWSMTVQELKELKEKNEPTIKGQ